MVMGFSMMLMLMGYNLSYVSSEAYNNYLQYYNRTTSHNLAAGFANMGSQVIYRTPNARPLWIERPLDGGTVSLWTDTLPLGRVKLTSTSNFQNYKDTVIIVWGQSRFSKFSYYSVIEGAINWASKDTIYGPFHTQDKMTVNYNPCFWGKVTNKLGITKNPSSSKPEFHAGYQTGIDIQMPTDFNPLKNAALSGGRYMKGKDVTISFFGNGKMKIKVGAAAETVEDISSYAPNGALLIDSANVRIKGVFSGQLTLAVLNGGASNKGKVYFDSSVVYKTNPLSDPSSTDLLGICADDSLVITNNTNNSNDISIQSALFSRLKGLGAEQYNNGVVRGRINLLGGVSQNQRAAVGTLSGGTVNSGYSKSYRYDERLMNQSPPYYPTTGSYEILSWYER
jgi:hypothetical protein